MARSSTYAPVGAAATFAFLLAAAACVESTDSAKLDAGTETDGGSSGTDARAFTDAGTTDATTDATRVDASDGADAAEPQCTSLVQQGQPVTVTTAPLPAPAATGGGLTDGTYLRTSIKKYGDAPLTVNEKAQTIIVTSSSIKLVTGPAGAGEQRTHLDYRTREQYVFFKVYCDTAAANVGAEFDATYDASPTTITLFTEPTDGTTGVVATTFTKL